jgi:hypothetical protein
MVLEWRCFAPSFVVLVAEIVVAVVVANTLSPTTGAFVVWDATLDHTYKESSAIPVRGVTTTYLDIPTSYSPYPS